MSSLPPTRQSKKERPRSKNHVDPGPCFLHRVVALKTWSVLIEHCTHITSPLFYLIDTVHLTSCRSPCTDFNIAQPQFPLERPSLDRPTRLCGVTHRARSWASRVPNRDRIAHTLDSMRVGMPFLVALLLSGLAACPVGAAARRLQATAEAPSPSSTAIAPADWCNQCGNVTDYNPVCGVDSQVGDRACAGGRVFGSSRTWGGDASMGLHRNVAGWRRATFQWHSRPGSAPCDTCPPPTPAADVRQRLRSILPECEDRAHGKMPDGLLPPRRERCVRSGCSPCRPCLPPAPKHPFPGRRSVH